MTNKFFLVLCNLAISCTMLQAQTLTFSNAAPNNSPQHLIQNVFVGNTITTLNHTFNGLAGNTTSSQVGFFSNGASTIGLDSGIVLTSGRIQTIAQNGFSSFNNFGPGDPDLLTISSSVPANTCPPTSTNDRAILEFDFVATTTDTITFDYVFASEEWPNFVCTVFNDVFAFLVSGPGINGPYSNNAINVAIVPGDTLPVSISSIHNGTAGCFTANCFGNPLNNAFYLSVTGPAFTFNAPNAKTTVLTTLAFPVNACDTYTVSLKIADGTDRIYDSAVFLEAGSFTGSGIVVTPAPSFDPFGSDTNFFEQCGVVDIIFVRTDTTGIYPAQCIDIDVAGSATPGVDYTPALPDSVCWQLGEDSAVV
ncbi:MAG: choice-of-anchor L domain-containing protein, partial [Bacteroidota bacterium]